jgi:hypothetical protein
MKIFEVKFRNVDGREYDERVMAVDEKDATAQVLKKHQYARILSIEEFKF